MPQTYEDLLDLDVTPVDYLDKTGDKEERTRIRTYLGSLKYTPDEMEHPIRELSGGQKAKVLLLRMSLSGANVLILDEPTAGLDPKGRDDILNCLKYLREETGMTIILVSHSMDDVATYVSRIMVMNDGVLTYDDTPRNVFRHYKELEAIGLAAPQVTYLMNDLKQAGIDVNTDAITIDEAKESILSALG